MIIKIISIFVIIFGTLFSVLTLNWMHHVATTKRMSKKYGKGSYKDFVKYFRLCIWITYRDHIEDPYQSCKITDDTIEFDGVHMIINNPISYYLVRKHIDKYLNRNVVRGCQLPTT